jgi:hypothetical protein
MLAKLLDQDRHARIYISSKMTGLPEWGYPGFFAAEARLREMGFNNIFNPAFNDDSRPRCELLAIDLIEICTTVDFVVVFGDWQSSAGACCEVAVAREIEKKIFDLDTGIEVDTLWCHYGKIRTRLG